jgi:hypothetical protein
VAQDKQRKSILGLEAVQSSTLFNPVSQGENSKGVQNSPKAQKI